MRIAMYVHYYLPYHFAGSEIYVHELLKELAASGHEVKVFATDETSGEWEFDGIQCISPKPGTSLHTDVKAFNPDVVITHHKGTPEAAHLARATNAKLVQVVHNERSYMHMLLDHGADLVIYNSQHVADAFTAKFPYPYEVLYPPTRPERHRTEPGDRVTLINLQPAKGSDVFYELVARMPDVEFLGVEGGYGEQRFDTHPNVVFQRQTTNMRDDVWARTKVLLVPSTYESWGMVGVEALASGIPVIASPTPGLLESLDYAGVFVPQNDVRSWERELRKLLDNEDVYAAASRLALKRSADLDPAEALARVVRRIEQL